MELNQWLRKTGLRLFAGNTVGTVFAGNTVGTVICWEYRRYGYLLGIQEVRLFAGNTVGVVICWEHSWCGYLLGTQLVWLLLSFCLSGWIGSQLRHLGSQVMVHRLSSCGTLV